MKAMKMFSLAFRIFALVSLAVTISCVSEYDTYVQAENNGPKRPPNPELNMGDWGEPSKPVGLSADPKKYEPNAEKVKSILRRPPQFPERAIYQGACRGVVNLQFDVDDEGVPKNIRVVDTDTVPAFEKAAVEALETWRFEPKIGDEPIEFRKALETQLSFHGCE